jgi:hypothetical protein
LVADRRNFFKVELWTRDGLHIERLLFAGNSLDKARGICGLRQEAAAGPLDRPATNSGRGRLAAARALMVSSSSRPHAAQSKTAPPLWAASIAKLAIKLSAHPDITSPSELKSRPGALTSQSGPSC